MGGGLSCPNNVDPVCPDEAAKSTMGGARLGDSSWHTETTSYVSVGLFNMYLTTQITSSGVMLGFFLGLLLSGGIMMGLDKRRKKMARRRVEKDREKEKAAAIEQSLQKVLSTGSHSSSWPAFKHPQPATAPPEAQPHQPHHLVPIAWGQ